jgi:hypothetical protein
MDINQPPAKPRDGGGWDALQVAREHDEPGVARAANNLPRVRWIGQHLRRHAGAPRPLECAGVVPARHDARDARDG